MRHDKCGMERDGRQPGRLARCSFRILHFVFFVSVSLALLSLPHELLAEVSVSLPLEGHYRAGHFMPVRVTAHGESAAITLSAHGAVPTEIPPGGEFDGVVPVLAVGSSLGDLSYSSPGSGKSKPLPLKALDDDERLVAFAGSDSYIAKQLFPGKTIVPVLLDPSRPLLDPPQAWESLDAVILSESGAARLDERVRELLVCGGTAIAIRSTRVPDSRWPWEQVGEYWVMRWHAAGPNSALSADAYLPTQNWERGWPYAFRRQVLLLGLIFSLLLAGTVLWPSRWAIPGAMILCGAAAAGCGIWYSRQSPVLALQADVAARAGPIEQRDDWTWQTSLRPTTSAYPATDSNRPVFASLRQIDSISARLRCRPDGSPGEFIFALSPGQSLAFLDRTLRVWGPDEPFQPADPRLAPFVDQLYVSMGDRMTGQFVIDDGTNPIPVIVVQLSKRPAP